MSIVAHRYWTTESGVSIIQQSGRVQVINGIKSLITDPWTFQRIRITCHLYIYTKWHHKLNYLNSTQLQRSVILDRHTKVRSDGLERARGVFGTGVSYTRSRILVQWDLSNRQQKAKLQASVHELTDKCEWALSVAWLSWSHRLEEVSPTDARGASEFDDWLAGVSLVVSAPSSLGMSFILSA
jgi:hypothetical protein